MYKFLASFNDKNYEEMSKTFFLMSSTPESCLAMRQSGCLPLLIQIIHCELDSSSGSSSSNSAISSSAGQEGFQMSNGNKEDANQDKEVAFFESIRDMMIQLERNSASVRQRAIESLNNIIHSQTSSQQTNREIKVTYKPLFLTKPIINL